MEAETGATDAKREATYYPQTRASLLHVLSGAKKSAATVTAYRAGLQQFARYLVEINCLIATPADTACSEVAAFCSYLAA